jgi:hypothetical protein
MIFCCTEKKKKLVTRIKPFDKYAFAVHLTYSVTHLLYFMLLEFILCQAYINL